MKRRLSGFYRSIKNWLRSGFRPAIKAGLDAEEIFAQLAGEKGWIMESIDQRRDKFVQYRRAQSYSKHSKRIKRGDFLCRNCQNREIEVKCKKKYTSFGVDCFFLDYSHLKKHQAMQELLHSQSIVLAIFERDGSRVLVDRLYMCTIESLVNTPQYKRGELYDSRYKCIKIPLHSMRIGFQVLDSLKGIAKLK